MVLPRGFWFQAARTNSRRGSSLFRGGSSARIPCRRRCHVSRARWPKQFGEDRFQRVSPDLISLQAEVQLVHGDTVEEHAFRVSELRVHVEKTGRLSVAKAPDIFIDSPNRRHHRHAVVARKDRCHHEIRSWRLAPAEVDERLDATRDVFDLLLARRDSKVCRPARGTAQQATTPSREARDFGKFVAETSSKLLCPHASDLALAHEGAFVLTIEPHPGGFRRIGPRPEADVMPTAKPLRRRCVQGAIRARAGGPRRVFPNGPACR